jgi:hypothetical protein
MMHSILSALPELVDDNDLPAEENQPKEEPPSEDFLPDIKPDPSDLSVASAVLQADLGDDHGGDRAVESGVDQDNILAGHDDTPVGQDDLSAGQEASVIPDVDMAEPDVPLAETKMELPPSDLPLAEPTAENKTELPSSQPPDDHVEEEDSAPWSNRRKVLKPKAHTLTDILKMADALYQTHPPADPSLQLSSIMGPQSVIFTWSTRVSDMPSRDDAERMVERLDLVVYPEPPVVESKERDTTMRHRNRSKRRAGTGTVGLLVGAGLVLGVAVAISVYSARGGDPRDWRKVGRWVGGVLAGASERVIRYRT